LENDICNLFYSCPICNRFKKDDWPGEPNLNTVSYPDPSNIDYSKIFNISYKNYLLIGLFKSSNYLINKLYLNRPQLVYERRETRLQYLDTKLTNEIAELLRKSDDLELTRKFIDIFTNIKNHLQKRKDIRPYKLAEIRRP
jgi:hypothetical protein